MNKPTISDFKAHFFRDFPYGTSLDTIQDADIIKAMLEADTGINAGLFTSQASYTLGYLYLTAHYLVMDLRASSQGISGSYSWLTASKGVGSVNESFSIPQWILEHPVLAMFSKTNYGAKYLCMVIPMLAGQVYAVGGQTQA